MKYEAYLNVRLPQAMKAELERVKGEKSISTFLREILENIINSNRQN